MQTETPCNRCGIRGVHSCTGEPIPPMQPEKAKELVALMRSLFPVDDSNS